MVIAGFPPAADLLEHYAPALGERKSGLPAFDSGLHNFAERAIWNVQVKYLNFVVSQAFIQYPLGVWPFGI
jgi:hypothetical protein